MTKSFILPRTHGEQRGESFPQFLERTRELVDRWLDQALPLESTAPTRLHQAMRYSVFAGGKRLRPALVLLANEAFGGKQESAKEAACAVEMIHSYSLIHDDLPCMDDSDLRRGRPSCHKAFDEATAVLAGDALLTSAFEELGKISDSKLAASLTRVLAKASGSVGMVGGQQEDLEAVGKRADLKLVEIIHRQKTAALITGCLEMGALVAGASEKPRSLVCEYGQALGLAFQITDDILDETGTSANLGKPAGQDAAANKMSYPACVGVESSQEKARALVDGAKRLIPKMELTRSDRLLQLADFIVERVS